MVAAVGFLAAALAAILLPEPVRHGAWLPLHLALAGGATTAIAGVMPFFSAAIAAAPPSDARLRLAAVAAVGLGAAGVAVAVVASLDTAAALSGLVFICGTGLVGAATIRPLDTGLGPRRGLVTHGYLAALGSVGIGAGLATLFLLGWPPIVEAWARVRVAHAWLNLIGFVSLVIATTLLHFFPTVVGARIGRQRSARIAVGGLASGAPLVAAGVLVASDALARLGAVAVLTGAGGLTLYAWQVWRTRTRWTTDAGWHAFAMGTLVSAIGWFDVGLVVAAGRVVITGADPAAWSVVPVAAPLVAGWIGLVLLGSVSHLVPAVGPGDPADHARQRRWLGRAGVARLVLANVAVATVSTGLWLDARLLTGAGLAIGATAFGATAALILSAVAVGLRARPASRAA